MIQLNRPKALNALSTPLVNELNEHLRSLDRDGDVNVIVITGGESFCWYGIPGPFHRSLFSLPRWFFMRPCYFRIGEYLANCIAGADIKEYTIP